MKYTILLLVVLGVIAAVCAMFLVQTMRVSMSGRAGGMVDVAVMKKSLPAMSMIAADAIEMSKVKAKEAPVGYLSSSAQVVGKILDVDVVQGQALTSKCLMTEGDEAQLAATIEPGMRAVSVLLSSNSVSGGLLYPGCIVDVLATFKLQSSGRNEVKGEAISTTLLYGIKVQAVQGVSVISDAETEAKSKVANQGGVSGNQRVSVVLLVDPKQAEALQLALDNGSVSLAMRNPLDQQDIRSEATVLNRGQLSKLGSLLGTTVRSQPAVMVSSSPEGGLVIEGGQEAEKVSYLGEQAPIEPSSWGVTIIRGAEVKEEEFKLSE